MTVHTPHSIGDSAVTTSNALACVILAHTDPEHVRRLIGALAPFSVFLHCDRRTDASQFNAMTANLPDRCRVLDRVATGWAKWENVEAELAGYRAALANTEATHIALLTGSDYPLASTEEIATFLSRYNGKSFAMLHELPYPTWGRSGGMARLRYTHYAYRKHMIRVPLPRRIPNDLVLAGGSQLKVLSRHHAQAIVDAADNHPELIRFWRRSWIADETFVSSILSTPAFVPDWPAAHLSTFLWWIGWGDARQKSPPWLGIEHFDAFSAHFVDAEDDRAVRLFARKFSTSQGTEVLDAIDERAQRGGVCTW